MQLLNGFDMRIKRLILWFFALSILIILWKPSIVERDVEKPHFLNDMIFLNKEQLERVHNQLHLIKCMYQNNTCKRLPTIYAITPTYARLVQKAELTRISQTLTLAHNVHWIVVEDSAEKTELVTNLLMDSNLLYTHLSAKTLSFKKLKHKHPRGVEQGNTGLKWLRENLALNEDSGVVYFMDDDNTYSVKLFNEISKVKRVGVWPVGLAGGYNAELPILDNRTGKVVGYKSGWMSDRPFAIDMAGFAINLDLILTKPNAWFSYKMKAGYQESEFLSYFTTKEELEPLASNCTQIYVWHTRTEKPNITTIISNLEV